MPRAQSCRDFLHSRLLIPVTALLSVMFGFPSAVSGDEKAEPDGIRIAEDDRTLALLRGDSVILVYNKTAPKLPDGVDPIFARSGMLHPVNTPSGRTITGLYPADHRHQNGIFSAWVRTSWNDRDIDFWNLGGGTGRVTHSRVVRRFSDSHRAGFEAELIHQALGDAPVDVLREQWIVTALVDSPPAANIFDLEVRQNALTDQPLIVSKYHYGGVAVRAAESWLGSGTDRPDTGQSADGGTGCRMANEFTADRAVGNHQRTRWVTISGPIDGQPACLTMMSHPGNFRAPQPARLHPSKPYFVFTPCVDESFTIDRNHPYLARYRFLVTDHLPDSEELESSWSQWIAEPQPDGR